MTLKEAYELMRKELWSLRAENKRLQKQLEKHTESAFPAEEKERLERHIHHLEQVCQTSESRYQDALKSIRVAERHRQDLEMQILDLNEQVSSLQEENAALIKRAESAESDLQSLCRTNQKLQRRLNTSFENSSLPSSALPFRKKVPNNRKPSGKKPGAQPGHRPHTVSRRTTTKEPVHLPIPEEFLNDPDLYPTGRMITRQLVDIRVCVDIRDFSADEFRSRRTGTRFHAPFPDGIVNKVNYGPSVKALAFLLNNYYNVSISKTQQCISDITGGIVDLSAGMICGLSAAFSSATLSDRASIFSQLRKGPVLYSDATVSNVNGSRKAVILCTDKRHVIYQHLDRKGHDGLSQTPVRDFHGTIVHDHDRSYYAYGEDHQECLAHVLRYLVGAMENEPHLSWHHRMHSLLQKMIHTAKRHPGGVPGDTVRALTEQYEQVLSLASREYLDHPPEKEYMDGFNLQKRMRHYQTAHLYFLSHPEVDPTNNISERELRKFKRKQKQAVVLRSDTGGQYICDALTIIETARMQHQNIYRTVEAVFTK